MKKSGLYLGFLAVSLALVSVVFVSGLLTTSRTLSSSGTVEGIGVEVYWDSGCTQTAISVDWGYAEPGDVVTRTVYVKNSGNTPMTLSMTYSDWDPVEAGDYLSLSWNREGATLDDGEVVQAVLTLTVSDQITGITTYSFNIVIEGTG